MTESTRKYRDRLLAAAYVLVRTEKDGFDGSLAFLEAVDRIFEELEEGTTAGSDDDTRARFTHQPTQKG